MRCEGRRLCSAGSASTHSVSRHGLEIRRLKLTSAPFLSLATLRGSASTDMDQQLTYSFLARYWRSTKHDPRLGESTSAFVFGVEFVPSSSLTSLLSFFTRSSQYSIGSFIRIPEKAALALSLFRPPPSTPTSAPSSRSSSTTLIPPAQQRPLRISFLSGATLITAFPYLVAKGFGYSGVSSLLGFPGVNERVLDGLLDRGVLGEQEGWSGEGEEKSEEGVEGGMILLGDFLEYPGGLVELFIAWNTIK